MVPKELYKSALKTTSLPAHNAAYLSMLGIQPRTCNTNPSPESKAICLAALGKSTILLLFMYISDIISSTEAVIGTENSVSITCNHGAGGLISLDWFLITVGGPVDGTGISIDGVKYRGASPSIEINNILASDEGLYRCSYVLQPNAMMPDITTEGESEGQCLYVLGESLILSLMP